MIPKSAPTQQWTRRAERRPPERPLPATVVLDTDGDVALSSDPAAVPAGAITEIDADGYLLIDLEATEGLRTVLLPPDVALIYGP